MHKKSAHVCKQIPEFLVSTRFKGDYKKAQNKLDEIKRKLWASKISSEVDKVFKIPTSPLRAKGCGMVDKTDIMRIKMFYKKNTFPNQQKFGADIVRLFAEDSRKIMCLAVAPTQSGKTGSMLSIVRNAMEFENTRTKLDNFFIITAHSDKAWITQTRNRFPKVMSQNIWHRNDLLKNAHKIKNIRDAWIIIDEAHIGCKVGQTLYRFMHAAGLFDIQDILDRNIKIVPFTATPASIENDIKSWGMCASVLSMDVPQVYVSVDKLIAQNRVLPCKPLCVDNNNNNTTSNDNNSQHDDDVNNSQNDVIENIREISPFVHAFDVPKFHIIRTPRGKKHALVIKNFKLVFDNNFDFISEPSIRNFDSLFDSAPMKHTFVFIKDKLRCAKTLEKSHIGILYDRHVVQPNHDSVLQGLLGRLTGFHHNSKSIVFSNFHVSSNIKPKSSASFWKIL